MSKRTRTALIVVSSSLIVGLALAAAGSCRSWVVDSISVTSDHKLSVFALCGLVAFLLNWLMFVPSYLAKTEHYFDLTGSLTYLTCIGVAVGFSFELDARSWIVAAMVVLWALRLGSFLFGRVRQTGGDGRFDRIKSNPLTFFQTWTLQAAWVFLTSACAVGIITATRRVELGVFAFVGGAMWLVGFAVEVVADQQKTVFRRDRSNDGTFIQTGLWSRSRHPNYAGEIVLWAGIAVMALPVLESWRWACLVSPIFVYLLLTRISGIPDLERRADRRWGDDAAYQAYKARTPVLWPRFTSEPKSTDPSAYRSG